MHSDAGCCTVSAGGPGVNGDLSTRSQEYHRSDVGVFWVILLESLCNGVCFIDLVFMNKMHVSMKIQFSPIHSAAVSQALGCVGFWVRRGEVRLKQAHRLCPSELPVSSRVERTCQLSPFLFTGFEKPSAIQQRAIKQIIKGRDVIAQYVPGADRG